MALSGKVAIVTGAASGIGLATARAFLDAGAAGVTLVDRSENALQSALQTFSDSTLTRVLTVQSDVASETDVERYISETLQKFGKLDISAQIAGITHQQQTIDEFDPQVFDRVMSVNVKGCFLGLKHSARAMKQQAGKQAGGSIILCGSQLGLDGLPTMSAYCASKFAVRGLTQSAAAELGPYNIRVNTVCPGPIETPMLNETPKDQWSKFSEKAMLERLGKPEEIANVMLFLASEQSSYMTGSTVKVDGGWSRFA